MHHGREASLQFPDGSRPVATLPSHPCTTSTIVRKAGRHGVSARRRQGVSGASSRDGKEQLGLAVGSRLVERGLVSITSSNKFVASPPPSLGGGCVEIIVENDSRALLLL
jgi:hypothetical protein